MTLTHKNNTLHTCNEGLQRRLTDTVRDNEEMHGAVDELLAERLSVSLQCQAAHAKDTYHRWANWEVCPSKATSDLTSYGLSGRPAYCGSTRWSICGV